MTTQTTHASSTSGSLEESLANAHITNQDGSPPVTIPLHQHPIIDYTLSEQPDGCFVLPKCALPPREKYEPVEVFVAKAVQSRLQPPPDGGAAGGALQGYKVILEAIRTKEDASLLYMIFLAIRTAAQGSTLHQLSSHPTKHAQLLHVLLRFDPFSGKNNSTPKDSDCCFRNYSLSDAYFHLILALVSANSVFLVPSMTSIWKLLITVTTDDPTIPRIQRIHATLATMMRLCPKSKTEIFPIIATNFPFRTRSRRELDWCYRQTFAVAAYVPVLESRVLQFVIDKCLEMDVEIKIHDGGEVTLDDASDHDDHENLIFDLELMGNAKTPEKRKDDLCVDEMADKLDALMVLTIQYFEGRGTTDVVEARRLFERCLPAFESSILITHRSKYVQFLLFYLCGLEDRILTAGSATTAAAAATHPQQHATLYREFCASLIGILMDPYRSTVVRQSAACYLASFVSRAKFAEPETVCESVDALLRWAEAYLGSLRAAHSPSSAAADARHQCDLHLLFYTICQAAFYVVCFRGAEAVRASGRPPSPPTVVDPEPPVDIGPARWSRLCGHALQPLKYCLETVREEFLNVAASFRLLDEDLLQRLTLEHQRKAFDGLRKKKKATVIHTTGATLDVARRNGGVGGLGRGSNPLDSFFPFDPCLLRRSHPYIEPFYRNWGEDYGLDEDGQDSGMDDEEEEDASHVSEDTLDGESYSSDHDEEERYRHQRGSIDETSMVSLTPPLPPSAVEAPREAWAETLKRNRAPSIETGSW